VNHPQLDLMDPAALEKIFLKDPLKLSDPEVDAIVANLRQKREIWQKEELDAKNEGRRTKSPKKDQKDFLNALKVQA
jgi:hypothetical protein